jgi:lactose/L-arabinose transport system substrate-binding protein
MSDNSENKFSRREVLRLLGLTAAGALLSACGDTGQTNATPTTGTAAGATPTTGAAAGTTATTAGAAAGAAATEAPGAAATAAAASGEIIIWDRAGDLFQVLDAAIPAFNKRYPHIKVTHQPVDVGAKLPSTLATGVNVPDGSFIEDNNLGPINEHLYDITDWIQPYVNDLVTYKVRVNTWNGKIKGIPYDVDPGLLYYRADILDQNGIKIEDIKTYDDLLTAAKTLKGKNPNLKPIHIENDQGTIPLWISMFLNQQGVSYLDEKGNLTLDNPEFRNVTTWLKAVVDAGVASRTALFSPDDIAADDKDVQIFVPYAIWYNYGIGNLLKTSKGKWRATRLPAWKAGGSTAASMGGSSFVIPAKGKNPQLAWLFYEYMMLNPEGYKAAFGANKIYATGIDTLLPSYKPAYSSQLMGNPAGLGGQNLWELATSVAADIPQNFYFPVWYNQLPPILGANIQKLYDGKLSPEDAVKQSASDIKAKLMR